MREAFSLTDVCLPSWDDITVLTGLDDRDAIVDYLLGCGIGLVALKLGAEGAYVATTESRTLVQPFAVRPLDATGAGDCFGGSFIARLAAGAIRSRPRATPMWPPRCPRPAMARWRRFPPRRPYLPGWRSRYP